MKYTPFSSETRFPAFKVFHDLFNIHKGVFHRFLSSVDFPHCSNIITPTGKHVAVRVDKSFLCECGSGKRVNGNKRFYSRACYGRFRRDKKDKQSNLRNPTCRWCGEIISKGDRYCSDKCRKTDYNRLRKNKTKGGDNS